MRKTGSTGPRSRVRVLWMLAVVAVTAMLTVACTQDPEEGSAGSTTSAPSGDSASASRPRPRARIAPVGAAVGAAVAAAAADVAGPASGVSDVSPFARSNRQRTPSRT